jgi:hypothetical protein
LNEPWRNVLAMPWDEVIRAVAAGQDIEDEGGAGAQNRLLSAALERLCASSE